MGKLLHLPVGEYAKILGYTEVLTSRPLGTHVLNETLKKISNVQAETVIECSFEGIEICDYSFVDEFLLNLQLKVLAWDLGGVLTSAKICVRQQDGFTASLDFNTRKENADLFKKSVTLLGMNPDSSHKLKLELTDESGMVREAEVDTGKLDFSDTSVLNCNIEINLTGTGTEVGIVDWELGCVEDIIL